MKINFTIDKIDTSNEEVTLIISKKFKVASVDKQDFNNRMQRLLDEMNELINTFDSEKVSKWK